MTVSPKTGKTTIVQALANLVGPEGPYAGEVVTAQTFLNPATPSQRGLRRACMKFLETFIEAAKEDDRTWAAQFPPEKAAAICGVPASEIVAAARMVAGGGLSIQISSCSIVHCVSGVQNERAVVLLSALTGSFGRPGGNGAVTAPKARLDDDHQLCRYACH